MVVASSLSASSAFLIARYLARDAVARRLAGNERFARVNRLLDEHAWIIIPFVRVVPVPFALNNYGFGLTSISFRRYLLLSEVGMIPMNAVLVLGAGWAIGIVSGPLAAVAAVAAVIVIAVAFAGRRTWRQSAAPRANRNDGLATAVAGALESGGGPKEPHPLQIGVDIGGTFTDIVALDGEGRLVLTKVPSTPKDLLEGIDAAVRRVLALAGAPASAVERFIHGTTVATNAVLEQKGAVTAILTTEGFEDVLEMGRQKRSRMYDLDMDPETPTFVAPRRRRIGIRERLDARGAVLVPLDEAQVRAAVTALKRDGVQAIAVCYLFSFVDPRHERRTREICREVAPEVSVSLSSDVDPTFREYERLCVTAFDAYLGPVVKRYLAGLAETLEGPRHRRRAARDALARGDRLGRRRRAAAGDALPLGSGGRRHRRQVRRRALGRAGFRLARHGRHEQ